LWDSNKKFRFSAPAMQARRCGRALLAFSFTLLSMQIKIRSKNLELDEKIKSYVEEKIGSLNKFLNDIQLVRVELSLDKHHRKGNVFYAEVMLEIKGNRFYTKEEAQDLYAAIDICREEMIQEIRKFKTKMRDKKRGEERRWKRWIKIWWWRK